MTLYSRFLVATTAGLALAGVVGCSGGGAAGGTDESATPSAGVGGLDELDVCGFFKPEDLTAAQVGPPGETFGASFEPGCSFDGENRKVSLLKNAEETVGTYQENGNFDRFEPTEVNGREAAEAVSSGSAGQGVCSTMVNAGSGVVMVTVQGLMQGSVQDPCGESKKIVTRIEPRLPEPE